MADGPVRLFCLKLNADGLELANRGADGPCGRVLDQGG